MMPDTISNKRTELSEWLAEHDKYELLGAISCPCVLENENLLTLRRAEKATEDIDEALANAAEAIKVLKNKYRRAGIGNAATAPAIATEFHRLIHSNWGIQSKKQGD